MSYSFSVGPPMMGDIEFASPNFKKQLGNKTTPKNSNNNSSNSTNTTPISQEKTQIKRKRNDSIPHKHAAAKYGKIKLICGPMFSGKSSELLRQMKVFEIANHKTLLIKYSEDNRYSEKPEVATHDKVMRKAVSCGKKLNVIPLDIATKFSVIGIDEGQFFLDLVDFAHEMANRGKTVIVAALDGDFKQDPFPQVAKLLPKSESIVKLTSVCFACLREATFSRRLDDNDKRVEVIGDSDIYASCCRRCLLIDAQEFRNNCKIRKDYRANNNTDDLYNKVNEITKNSSEESLPKIENEEIVQNGNLENEINELAENGDFKNSLTNGNSSPENDENMVDSEIYDKNTRHVKRKLSNGF